MVFPPIYRRPRVWFGVILALFALPAAGIGWLYMQDPLDALPWTREPLQVVHKAAEVTTPAADGELREIRQLTMRGDGLGEINISISLPAAATDEKLPVLIILGGLRTGRNSIAYVPKPGRNVLVGFDYPIQKRIKLRLSLLPSLPTLRRQLLRVPGQVAALTEWLGAQAWVDAQRISLLGFSLGALYLPAVHRATARQGIKPGPTIIAYGGADLGVLVHNRMNSKPAWMRLLATGIVDSLLRPLEPAAHLPHLRGEFLLLGSSDADKFIPASSSALLHELTPEPKTIIALEGGHVGGRQAELTRLILEATGDWLEARGAVNR